MTGLYKLDLAEQRFQHSFSEVYDDTMYLGSCKAWQLAYHILGDAMEDKEDWIGYYIYEQDYKPKKGCITINKKKIDITTLDKFYDFLVHEAENIQTVS